MKVLVCGGRDFADRDRVFAVLDFCLQVSKEVDPTDPLDTVIHGACGWDADEDAPPNPMRGADALADDWAHERDMKLYRVPAAWRRLGRKAGPIRNSGMLAYCPDVVIAFPGGKGTAGMIALAKKDGIPTYEVKPRETIGDILKALRAARPMVTGGEE
jgi:hypothetical protein